jgi:hypothetical protein
LKKNLGVIVLVIAKVSDGSCINKKCPQLVGGTFS